VQYQKAFEQGIEEFNSERFFECHDTFEEIWQDLRGEKKRFVQGLIHSAVGIFHATRENYRGAESQLSKALDKLDPYRPDCLGVNVESLVSELTTLLDSIRRGVADGAPSLNRSLIPTIAYTADVEEMEQLN